MLFAICLLPALLGLQTGELGPVEAPIEVLEHPALLVATAVGLVFLLVLELADRILVRTS